MLKPITIQIKYDSTLQKITKKAEHPCVMSEGSTFIWLLQNINSSYPKIFETYKPGELGILLNNKPINHLAMLMDGDVVEFQVA